MMKVAALCLALAVVQYASAECANACSGHGVCSTSDQCDCFPNYRAADCSERVCPYGLAWVDSPRGDLDHDGVVTTQTNAIPGGVQSSAGDAVPIYSFSTYVWYEYEQFPRDTSTGRVAQKDEGHFYSECSNRGICDREMGQCVCFDGYTGSSCQRTTCPNDCSGHGVCRTVEEVAVGALNYMRTDNFAMDTYWRGVGTSQKYNLWDRDMAQTCVCDGGYSGADCSQRECPRGDDPLTHRPADCGGFPCAVETQTFTLALSAATDADWTYITFKDWTGKTWKTNRFLLGGGSATASGSCSDVVQTAPNVEAKIQQVLRDIPNKVLDSVTASCSLATTTFTCTVTFAGKPGNVNALTFVSNTEMDARYGECTAAATSVTKGATFTNTATVNGNEEEATCSNRGVCDYGTGLCKCFRGYTLDDCSTQNALAQ